MTAQREPPASCGPIGPRAPSGATSLCALLLACAGLATPGPAGAYSGTCRYLDFPEKQTIFASDRALHRIGTAANFSVGFDCHQLRTRDREPEAAIHCTKTEGDDFQTIISLSGDRAYLAYARANIPKPEQAGIVIYRVDCDPEQ